MGRPLPGQRFTAPPEEHRRIKRRFAHALEADLRWSNKSLISDTAEAMTRVAINYFGAEYGRELYHFVPVEGGDDTDA